jgi:hypothetical protein
VVELSFFKGYKILDSHVNDTLLIGEACVENLWSMNTVLGGFILERKLGKLPFVYLGLLIGLILGRLRLGNH